MQVGLPGVQGAGVGTIAVVMTLPTGPLIVSLGAFFHDIDPIAFVVPGIGFPVRWYGLSYIAGFVAAYFMLSRMARAGLFRVPAAAVGDVMLGLVAGTIVGGRLGYVLVYQPSLLTELSGSFPFWGVLEINNGGMASHGGMVGIVVACLLVARVFKVPRLHVMDAIVLVAPVGVIFGRLANFINGELLGKVVSGAGENAPGWAVRYPQELSERGGAAWDRLDTQQQVDFANTMAAFLPAEYPAVDAKSVALEGARFAIAEMHAGSSTAAAALEPYVSARHPSQLYQAVAEGLATLVVGWLVFRGARKPGVVTAWFLIVYGVGRVLTEFIRLPDAHLTVARVMGLSRGQWLSVGMVLFGVLLLLWVMRRNGERMSGWGMPRSERLEFVVDRDGEK